MSGRFKMLLGVAAITLATTLADTAHAWRGYYRPYGYYGRPYVARYARPYYPGYFYYGPRTFRSYSYYPGSAYYGGYYGGGYYGDYYYGRPGVSVTFGW